MVTAEGASLVCVDELADALGVPVLVMMPNVRGLLDPVRKGRGLSRPPRSLKLGMIATLPPA